MKRKPAMTLGALLDALQKLTPEQLAMPACWCGDSRGGQIQCVEILTEDQINPSGEGMEPVSSYQPGGEHYEEGMDILADEPIVARKGQMLLMTDDVGKE
jgi:hypothetical protein